MLNKKLEPASRQYLPAFIIHSGKDEKTVKQRLQEIKSNSPMFAAEIMNSAQSSIPDKRKNWRRRARENIRKSRMVIFFVGAESYKSENIAWELDRSMQYKKRILCVLLDSKNELPKELQENGKLHFYCEFVDIHQVCSIINSYQMGQYDLFNTSKDIKPDEILLEQYKLFVATSEDLVNRRQNVNSFYITVNSSLLAVAAPLSAMVTDNGIKIGIQVMIVLVGIILCSSWIRLLESYGKLNSSKMKVICLLEQRLPASLYTAEWAAMSDRLNDKPYVSFTKNEKRIPVMFIVLYSVFLCLMAINFFIGV